MTRKELNTIRLETIDDIIKTLLMAGEKIQRTIDPKKSKYIPFTWNGRDCSVYARKPFRYKESKDIFIPVELATDTHSDFIMHNGDMVFVDYTDKTSIYRIASEDLYKSLFDGIEHDSFHFRQTSFDVLKNTGKCINVELNTFTSLGGMKVYNLDEMRRTLPITYKPLVNKLTKQFYDRGLTQWDQIESMAWEGFAIAMHTYDDTRSKMNFTQFAAFAIRNNILTSLDNELRTVKLSNYAQKKATEAGETLFNTVSIDYNVRDDEHTTPREIKLNMVTKSKFDDGDVFEYMYTRLEENFSKKECEIFYKVFGLKGFEETKGKDVAKQLGVSEGLISQKIKKITSWIRKDNDICEMLQNLL